ncbi:MAG TPA: nuclear transport factor 2 family protein [Solirubrobacteraceae bacterium]|nr:nuclear transport factor 2 family protein [Solirubrobacteraceae bacterium]
MHEQLIRDLYASFNARDIEAVIAHLDPDVDWPNAWEGGRLRGHGPVREYWTRQFAAIDGRVEPTAIVVDADTVTVTVHQTVRDLDGQLQDDRMVTHTYTFRDGKVVRMDVADD